MGKNSRKRKSSTAGAASGSHQRSESSSSFTSKSPPPSPPLRPQSGFPNPPSSESSYLTSIAAVILALIEFSKTRSNLAILLGALVVILLVGYGLSVYILWPFAKFLLDYPLAPVRWILVKAYSIVSYVLSWITWIVKGAAWTAFYLHFGNKFIEGGLWALEQILAPLAEEERKKQLQQQQQEEAATSGNQQHHHDEDEDSDDDVGDDDERPPGAHDNEAL